jgi:UDP-N-acetylglucosamine:LPS N-acetylglucosamine transferase
MSGSTHESAPLILVALCGGGWHRETLRILERIPTGEFRFAYAYGHHSGVHGASRLPMPHPGPCFPIHYLGPTKKRWSRLLLNPLRLAASFIEAWRLVRRLRPSAVFALGTATAVPLFFAARCHGATCVFIESLTRVDALSLTGKIVRHLKLADRFYVQWDELAHRAGGTVFAGAVA